jgi:hypothetical protein
MEDNDLFKQVLKATGCNYFPSQHAWKRQRNYMRYHVFMGKMKLSNFTARLEKLSSYLTSFPVPDNLE